MHHLMLLPLLALAACGADDVTSRDSTDNQQFASQLEAPSPDYAALIANTPEIAPPETPGAPALVAPRVSEAALPAVRQWPASQTRTGFQMEAAFTGCIYLRDGCIFVRGVGEDQPDKLAWFHAETGLDLDAEGYYTLIDRKTGQISGRLGEMMTWAGPNPLDNDDPAIATYREACGDYEVEGVGNPMANERRYVIYPHLRQPPDAAPPPGIE